MKHFMGECIMSIETTDYILDNMSRALLDLMKEKDYNKITVTDITNRAGTGRVSFYRNFESKEDILRGHLKRITDDFIKRMNFDFRRDAHTFYITGLFYHLDSNRELLKLLDDNGLIYLVKEEFDRAFQRNVTNEKEKRIAYMASGAYFNLFYYWLKDGFKESPEELAEIEFSI